jgi:hypothetical protein
MSIASSIYPPPLSRRSILKCFAPSFNLVNLLNSSKVVLQND